MPGNNYQALEDEDLVLLLVNVSFCMAELAKMVKYELTKGVLASKPSLFKTNVQSGGSCEW